MLYGRAIRLLRSARGISQKALAEKAGVDASYISYLEREQRSPSSETLKLISKALSVPTYLITFLASEQAELRGITEEQAQAFGKEVLKLLMNIDLDE